MIVATVRLKRFTQAQLIQLAYQIIWTSSGNIISRYLHYIFYNELNYTEIIYDHHIIPEKVSYDLFVRSQQ